ncbi:MAG: hypothetical protein LBT14_09895 [Treponema sp.]|jgi:hypothetical protein|nr:hypothetical protein [Treponema sp.]
MKTIAEIIGGAQGLLDISYNVQDVFEAYLSNEHKTFLHTACAHGCKKNSHGNTQFWTGYKLHLCQVNRQLKKIRFFRFFFNIYMDKQKLM